MPLVPAWSDIATRIAVCLAAGAVIGLNRGESGKAAGLRTTMLVCLAAGIAMLQVNLLLAQAGKPNGSFVVLDLMRLPLGILSGVGFIGAGAILRKDGLVTGVTTAATLWFVTVIGLCAGGGQLALAGIGTALGFGILWGLKALEARVPHKRRVLLVVDDSPNSADTAAMLDRLKQLRCRIEAGGTRFVAETGRVERRFDIQWVALERDDPVERAIDAFVQAGRPAAGWTIAE